MKKLLAMTLATSLLTFGSAAHAVMIDNFNLFGAGTSLNLNLPGPNLPAAVFNSGPINIGSQILTPQNNVLEVWVDFVGHQRLLLVDGPPGTNGSERILVDFLGPNGQGSGGPLGNVNFELSGLTITSPTGPLPQTQAASCLVNEVIGASCSSTTGDLSDGFIQFKDIHFRLTVTDFGGLNQIEFDAIEWEGRGNFVFRDIPEPGTLAILGLGLVGLGVARRKRAA